MVRNARLATTSSSRPAYLTVLVDGEVEFDGYSQVPGCDGSIIIKVESDRLENRGALIVCTLRAIQPEHEFSTVSHET